MEESNSSIDSDGVSPTVGITRFEERLDFYSLSCIVFFLVIDYVSTMIAIKKYGLSEGNPICQILISFGVLLEVKIVLTILFVVLLYTIKNQNEIYSVNQKRFIDLISGSVTLLFIIVGLNNLSLLFSLLI